MDGAREAIGDTAMADDEQLRNDADRFGVLVGMSAAHLVEGLQSFDRLKAHVQLPDSDPIAVLASKLRARLADPAPIVTPGKIGADGRWWLATDRHTIGISNVAGKISALKFGCSETAAGLPQGNATHFTIPPGWTKCGLEIFGEQGVTFDVTQAM